MKRRVLVTGGLGYVGGRVAEHLLSEGWDVSIASRNTHPEKVFGESISYKVIDFTSSASLDNACKGMDAVVHLAAMNEVECIGNVLGALESNVLNTSRLLESAIAAHVQTFLYFSTAHVYCSPLQGELHENMKCRPAHPYATTHLAAEEFILEAHRRKRIHSVVLRLSNGIGYPVHASVDRWTLLVNDLCRQAVVTDCLTLKSSGKQLRDFITLRDVASCVAHMLQLPIANVSDEPIYNIGSGISQSVLEMAQRIQRLCPMAIDQDVRLEVATANPLERIDHMHYCVDKILSSGFVLTNDFDAEITEMLVRCRAWFTKRNVI